MANHTWRCFHCDEVFRDREAAALHFGKFQDCVPACKVGVEAYRALEDEVATFRSESDAASKRFYELGAAHSTALMRAEEKGYGRALADGREEKAPLEAKIEELLLSLKVVRQSLVDQAAARADPTMPVLKPEVREALREDAEARYACAENQKERIEAHGLFLLMDWQDRAAAATPAPGLVEGQEALIKHMVNRFLGWRLPENFRPDGGIQFDPDGAKKLNPRNHRYEPTGTNLFDCEQADAMVRYMLEGAPAVTSIHASASDDETGPASHTAGEG